MGGKIKTYSEFWPFYLSQHSKKSTKLIHIFGTLFGITVGVASGPSLGSMSIVLGLVIAYGLLWAAHFFIEKNKPATFQYPFWSFISDFRMILWFFLGKLELDGQKLEKTSTELDRAASL